VRHVHQSPSALSTRQSDGGHSQTTLTERQQTTITADVESRRNKKRAKSSSANRAVKKIMTSRMFASSAPSSEDEHSKPTPPTQSVAKRPMTPPCIFPDKEMTDLEDKLPIDVVLGYLKFEVDSTNLFETCAENLVALYPNSEAFVFPAGMATHILQSFLVEDQGDVYEINTPDDLKLLAVLGVTQIDLSYSKLTFFPHVNVWELRKGESGAWNLTVIDTVNRKLMNFNASGESPEREPVIMATVAKFLRLLAEYTPNTAACVHPNALTWLQPKNYSRNKERVFTGSLILHYMHCFLKGVVIDNCDPQSNFPVSLIETLIFGVGYRTCSMENGGLQVQL